MPTAARQKMSSYHKKVLLIGGTLLLISLPTFIYSGNRAVWPSKAEGTRQRNSDFFLNVIASENVRDTNALVVAQLMLATLIISVMGTMLLVIIPAAIAEQRAPRADRSINRPTTMAVGDRVTWEADDGTHTGVVEQTHHKPFTFDGESHFGSSFSPGYVISDDATGALVARGMGMAFAIIDES